MSPFNCVSIQHASGFTRLRIRAIQRACFQATAGLRFWYHCRSVGSAESIRQAKNGLGQSADGVLSALLVGPYGSSVLPRLVRNKIGFNPCFAFRRQAAKPDKRAAHVDSNVSIVRNHQRFP